MYAHNEHGDALTDVYPVKRAVFYGLLLPVPAHPVNVLIKSEYFAEDLQQDGLNLRLLWCFRGYNHRTNVSITGKPEKHDCTPMMQAYSTVTQTAITTPTKQTIVEKLGEYYVVTSVIYFDLEGGGSQQQQVWIDY